MRGFALSIAGSDSSGAAGIQADQRSFAFNEIGCATAVTAITAQGPSGVEGIHLVDPSLLQKQMESAFGMYEIQAVKVGMLGSEAQVRAVARVLKAQRPPIVILDPVVRSTSGARLLDEEGVAALVEELLPLATLLTPNTEELQVLANRPVSSPELRLAAAHSLIHLGAQAVLVKGGHLQGAPDDLLVFPDQPPERLPGERVQTIHDRGTGCTLSSLIAGYQVLGFNLSEAIAQAKAVLTQGLKRPLVPKAGRGYPLLSRGPRHGVRLESIQGVYFVSDSRLGSGISHASGARSAIRGGASVVQLREKELGVDAMVRLAKEMGREARERNVLFIVNDRVDIALAADADGVHLGPGDMDPADARAILGDDRLIGVSVATVDEARAAAPYASYLAVGAIFGSSTKSDAGPPVGLERLRQVRAACPDAKIVAIGGIHLSNIASVAAAGADAAAVVSAIVCARNPEQATRDLVAEFADGVARARS